MSSDYTGHDPKAIAIPADPNDPEDRDVSYEGVEQGLRAREVRVTRTNLGLTQDEFATRFGIPLGTLRDWEQARSMPPAYVMTLIRLIRDDPEAVARAAAA